MSSVYFFDVDKAEYDKNSLPQNLLAHCKKEESIFSAIALIDMGAENLSYRENGKPVADNCFVSISHSKNMVAVCRSDRPIGIDIEFIDDTRNLEKIAKRTFKGRELEVFENCRTAECFYEIWTKKEAYSKISGNGVIAVMKGFDIFALDDYDFSTETVEEYVISICEEK